MAKAIARRRARVTYIRGGHRRRSKGFTLPLAAIAGFSPLAWHMVDNIKAFGLPKGVAGSLSLGLVGYDLGTKKFDFFAAMRLGWGPILAGILVHKVASRLGVNRLLGRAGVPIIRV